MNWAAAPQHCQRVFSASSANGDEPAESRSVATGNLAKIAHRGGGYAPEPARAGKWPNGPAMTTLRFALPEDNQALKGLRGARNQGQQGLQRHQGRALRRMMNDE